MSKDFTQYTIKQLLVSFANLEVSMMEFHHSDDTFGKRFDRTVDEYNAILAEADRRDKNDTLILAEQLRRTLETTAVAIYDLAKEFDKLPPELKEALHLGYEIERYVFFGDPSAVGSFPGIANRFQEEE